MDKVKKINICNPTEFGRFRRQISGFMQIYGFPYRLDDITGRGANYTVFCPIAWKYIFPPDRLKRLLKEDVDADKIKVAYIAFVREPEEKKEKIWNVDYF